MSIPSTVRQLFLTGHSMGSDGTWYRGAKYADYWRALAPMSGPFVLKYGYPWENLRNRSVFITEGSGSVTPVSSRELYGWMKSNGFEVEYREVNADHGGMVSVVLSDVFDFFDRSRSSAVQ